MNEDTQGMVMCEKERLVSYIYDELNRAERAEVEAHLKTCAACREEAAGMRSVRTDLASWTPPQPEFGFHIVRERKPTWREWWTPAFGLAAAAVLVLAIASAIANVDVTYAKLGLHLRTGWGSTQASVAPLAPATASPRGAVPADTSTNAAADVRVLLAALDTRVRQLESAPRASGMQQAALKGARQSDAEILKQVRDLLAQSESKQQQELALRIAQVIRDVDAQRVADLNRIQQGFGRIDAMTTAEAAAHRDLANYIVASSRQR
jgi:signal transduction histidine kinase